MVDTRKVLQRIADIQAHMFRLHPDITDCDNWYWSISTYDLYPLIFINMQVEDDYLAVAWTKTFSWDFNEPLSPFSDEFPGVAECLDRSFYMDGSSIASLCSTLLALIHWSGQTVKTMSLEDGIIILDLGSYTTGDSDEVTARKLGVILKNLR